MHRMTLAAEHEMDQPVGRLRGVHAIGDLAQPGRADPVGFAQPQAVGRARAGQGQAGGGIDHVAHGVAGDQRAHRHAGHGDRRRAQPALHGVLHAEHLADHGAAACAHVAFFGRLA